MAGDELDAELEDEEGPEEPSTPLTGGLPPDEGEGEPAPARAGTLSSNGLADPIEGSPVQGSIPFLKPNFDPIVYFFTLTDAQSREHRAEYAGLSRSEAVVHFLTRLCFEDWARKLETGAISGLVNLAGDKFLTVMRAVNLTALDELRAQVRSDVISTLVQRGVAEQQRLEEVLGVASHGVA